jgi:hypothetical protein
MTEAEWLICRSAHNMLELLRPRLSDRKLRLFQVACCRRMWDIIPDDRWRELVIVAERYADKEATDKMRIAARNRLCDPYSPRDIHGNALHAAGQAARKTMEREKFLKYGGADVVVGEAARSASDPALIEERYAVAFYSEHQAEADFLRDIFGNPFHKLPTIKKGWLTDTVMAITRQMYESRDFGAMPILADALQDAGCDNEEVLDHCRGPGPHVRGCWVVDLVLGKE